MRPNHEKRALNLLNGNRPTIIAHRGFSAAAPENTIASFQLALLAGADAVEMDYQHSKDGIPVVFHDSALDRTTNARQIWGGKRLRVSDRTVAEIQCVDAGSWRNPEFSGARVPTLADALNFIHTSGSTAVVERKSGDAATCARLLMDLDLVNETIVISFDWSFLRDLHQLLPQQIIGALGPPSYRPDGSKRHCGSSHLNAEWLDKAIELGAKLIIWNQKISRKSIELTHQNGLFVWIYTIDSTKAARKLTEIGADGIITNNPLKLAKLRTTKTKVNSAASASQRRETGR